MRSPSPGYEPIGHCRRVQALEWGASQGRRSLAGPRENANVAIKAANLKARYSSSAQTGYDSNAYLYYHFEHAGYLCGTNKAPSRAAQLVRRQNLPAG